MAEKPLSRILEFRFAKVMASVVSLIFPPSGWILTSSSWNSDIPLSLTGLVTSDFWKKGQYRTFLDNENKEKDNSESREENAKLSQSNHHLKEQADQLREDLKRENDTNAHQRK